MFASALLAAFLSLQAADLQTTCKGFAHGYGERNPFVPENCRGAVAVTAATDVAVVGLTQALIKRPRTRALVYGILAGIEFGAAAHNYRAMRGK